MRWFGVLLEKAASALLGDGFDQQPLERVRRAMDSALAKGLRQLGAGERESLAGDARPAQVIEALLSELVAIEPDPRARAIALGQEEGERFFWEPLAARASPALWRGALDWIREREVPASSLGLEPMGFALKAVECEILGEPALSDRLLEVAFELGLRELAINFEASGKGALGLALESGALKSLRALREAGFSWESAGLGERELAQGASLALWPEPLEALASAKARVEEGSDRPWLDFSEAFKSALMAGEAPGLVDERAARCAAALAAMGADPNRAPKKPREGRQFPLEAALLAKAPLLAEALLNAGASPDDARVKGRLERAIREAGEDNLAAAPIQSALASLKERRDQRYALWGMCLRGELFDAQGRRVEAPASPRPYFKERVMARAIEISAPDEPTPESLKRKGASGGI